MSSRVIVGRASGTGFGEYVVREESDPPVYPR